MKTLRVEVRQGSTMWTRDVSSFNDFLELIQENPFNKEKNKVDVWAVVYGEDGEECDTEYMGEFVWWLEDGDLYTADELNDEVELVSYDIRSYFAV